jgi:hypothetical protein
MSHLRDGARLYRLHDDIWFWGQERTCAKRWGVRTEFAQLMGHQFNEEKTGSVRITRKPNEKTPRTLASLQKFVPEFDNINSTTSKQFRTSDISVAILKATGLAEEKKSLMRIQGHDGRCFRRLLLFSNSLSIMLVMNEYFVFKQLKQRVPWGGDVAILVEKAIGSMIVSSTPLAHRPAWPRRVHREVPHGRVVRPARCGSGARTSFILSKGRWSGLWDRVSTSQRTQLRFQF